MDIQLQNISIKYDDKRIFNDINVTFPEERMSCLMGASGIGKTTLINIIMGLVKPDSGEILGCKNKKFAAVFQEDRLIEHWDAVKNIKLVCDKAVTEEQIRQELWRVGLIDTDNKPVRTFSGGMRRRVGLIRAILAKSDILIMDEPFKGLDEELKKLVITYVKDSVKGKTVIVVTHEKEEAQLLGADIITI